MRLDRISEMEDYILQHRTVSLTELASHFSISLNTVRRDVRELIARGKVSKVYGGVSATESILPLPLTERKVKNRAEKQIIASLPLPSFKITVLSF